MARWPDVASLAGASLEDVNEAWAGLGYYRRARFLLEGAKHIQGASFLPTSPPQTELKGVFPTEAEGLKTIPGIGAYTAGAVSSIAFARPAPLVDGNVTRVLSRLRALPGDPSTPAAAKTHWALAKQLVCAARPGDFNQVRRGSRGGLEGV
eukprot:1196346-Prorocentrum_minimum.AAC.1